VPDLRIFQLVVPVADPRQWRVHDDPSCHALRELGRQRVAHHVADVVGDKGKVPEPELIEDGGEVPRLRHLFVAGFGMGRQAHAAQVGNDDGVIADQRVRERHPHVAGVAEAVEKQDGRSFAANADVLAAARHRHLPCVEGAGPGANRHDESVLSRNRRKELWRTPPSLTTADLVDDRRSHY
jgi:hypothetical protein